MRDSETGVDIGRLRTWIGCEEEEEASDILTPRLLASSWATLDCAHRFPHRAEAMPVIMSVLDNLLSGRHSRIKTNPVAEMLFLPSVRRALTVGNARTSPAISCVSRTS